MLFDGETRVDSYKSSYCTKALVQYDDLYESTLVSPSNNTSRIMNMEQTIIRELNQSFRIYFPYEEISIYLQQSKLSDSPLPAGNGLSLNFDCCR